MLSRIVHLPKKDSNNPVAGAPTPERGGPNEDILCQSEGHEALAPPISANDYHNAMTSMTD